MARTKVFISYSHEDDGWRKRVVGQLAVLVEEGLIELCDDRTIAAGEDWLDGINVRMLNARIAMLLVSSSFLTSRFIRDEEVPKLFARHERSGMKIYPLLLKPRPWQVVGWLARMQMRPLDAKPLASFRGAKVEEVLASVALEIASLARQFGKRATSGNDKKQPNKPFERHLRKRATPARSAAQRRR